MNFNQKVEICWWKKYRLIHFIIYFQIFNQNFIWSWMIYIACSLKIRIYLICNHFISNRYFRIFSTHAISITFSILKFHTNSHYVMFQCNDFICLQNDRIRKFQNLHMFAKIFRENFRFIFRFTFFDFRKFFIQF